MKLLLRIACVLLAGAVFYLSWLPQPQLAAQVPMPGFFAALVDAETHQNLRTAVPFLLWGLAAGFGLWQRQARTRAWWIHGLLMVATACLAELGQRLIPARTCDLGDIGWAAAGAAVGLGGVLTVAWILRLAVARRDKSAAGKLEILDGAAKEPA